MNFIASGSALLLASVYLAGAFFAGRVEAQVKPQAPSTKASTVSPAQRPAPPRPEPSRGSALRYDYEYPLVGYAEKPAHNAFARLQEKLDSGEAKLEWKAPRGYLDSLLKALNIDPSSQTLVFSKTSLEISYITDQTPRAIYFDEDTYVAWVQGAPALELMAVDSVVGPVFYTLPNRQPATHAKLNRETLRCLNCHDSYALMGGGVPHFLMVSTYAGIDGDRAQRAASIDTTDATPMKNRWGGWYVTGKDGGQSHLGNVVIRSKQDIDNIDALRKGSVDTLQGLFDTKPYITEKSDIVALLVLQHQVTVHNLITKAHFKAPLVVSREIDLATNPDPTWEDFSPRTQKALRSLLEPLVRGLLNADAAAWSGPVAGDSGFDAWFQKVGPKDPKGRSLRELDLQTRLFRYPLSYLIYSDGFEALPEYVKTFVYQRLDEVLTGEDQSGRFTNLTVEDRKAILEILTATKPAFAKAANADSSSSAS